MAKQGAPGESISCPISIATFKGGQERVNPRLKKQTGGLGSKVPCAPK